MALLQASITVVVFVVMLGGARPRPRARPLRHRAPGERPRPRVRHRLPAPRQGPRSNGRDALLAQLAADRRLRQARGRGRRRLGRPALVRARSRCPRSCIDPARRRADEPPRRVRHLLPIAWLSTPIHGRPASARSRPESPAAGGRAPGGRRDRLASTAGSSTFFGDGSMPGRAPDSAGKTVTLGVLRATARSATVDRDASTARQIDDDPRGPRHPSGSEAVHHRRRLTRSAGPAAAVGSASTGRRARSSLILGGLGELGSAIVDEPDRAAAGRRARSASRSRSATCSGRPGPSCDALPRRDPVGQPRAREHPAVPAARRRPDAGDPAQGAASATGSALQAERLTYLVGFGAPVRVPDLDHVLRHRPARRRRP